MDIPLTTDNFPQLLKIIQEGDLRAINQGHSIDLVNHISQQQKDRIAEMIFLRIKTEMTQATGENPKPLETDIICSLINFFQKIRWTNAIVPLLKLSTLSNIHIKNASEKALELYASNLIVDHSIQVLKGKIDLYAYDFEKPGLNYPIELYAIMGLAFSSSSRALDVITKLIRNGTQWEKMFALRAFQRIMLRSATFRNLPTSKIGQEIKEMIETLSKDTEGDLKVCCRDILGEIFQPHTIQAPINPHAAVVSGEPEVLPVPTPVHIYTEEEIHQYALQLVDFSFSLRQQAVQFFWNLNHNLYSQFKEGDIIDRFAEPVKTEVLTKLVQNALRGNTEYRKFAVFWLGFTSFKDSFHALMQNLDFPDDGVKVSTLRALGVFGNRTAIKYIIPLISHENPDVAHKSIETLGSLGMDGIYALIHAIYRIKTTSLVFMEDFLKSFGGPILRIISKEIEVESDPIRQKRLQEFYMVMADKYKLPVGDFMVLL